MKKSILLFALLLCGAPVFAAPTGMAVEVFTEAANSDGTVGVGYYASSWAAGVSGSLASQAGMGSESRSLQMSPWVEVRSPLDKKTDVFAGAFLGIGFSGLNNNKTITEDYSPGLFAGISYQLSEKFLLQGYSAYTARSYKVGADTYSNSSLSATLGLSYFL